MKKGIDILVEAAKFFEVLQKTDSKARLAEVQASMIDVALEAAHAEGHQKACRHFSETGGFMDE